MGLAGSRTVASVGPRRGAGGTTLAVVAIYRRAWWRLAVVVGLTALAGFLALLLTTLVLLLIAPGARSGNLGLSVPLLVVSVALVQLAVVLPWLLGMAAAAGLADDVLGGRRLSLRAAYARALARGPHLVGALALFTAGMLLAGALSLPTFQLWRLGLPVGAAGLAVWVLVPRLRRPWLRWLVILALPFGVFAYFVVRWALWLPAVVVEGRGPLAGLRRSGELVGPHWPAVTGAVLGAFLALALLTIPVTTVILAGLSASGDALALDHAGAIGTPITGVLFGALPVVALTALMARLREPGKP
ncbi:MAG TPA: hypothetical protein VG245_04100 [Candidatus Dormibacteraeota bacterium]|jgi:hypothetical protein|nr:hypothetical protein [Candidatus Dormibacteraeota bacterium]